VADEEYRLEELAKLTFELCKHLTTLSTAGALIVLAVYRELTFQQWLLGLTLILFGLTILVSVTIMLSSMTIFTAQGRAREDLTEVALMVSARVSSYLFAAAVWTFMLFLLDYSYFDYVVIGMGVIGLVLSWFLFGRRLDRPS
jgi:ABC-type uncharacterized transport system permease subunit